MCDYPRERKGQRQIWANRLIRLLQKSCAANAIGIEACWLVTCVALVEDAKHYSGAVTFWTGQLLPITGFQSWGRLDRARERAVAAGWLYYRGGTNRQCGVYWTLIPESVLKAFNDFPVDEVDHQNGDISAFDHQNGDSGSDRNGIETGLKRDDAVNLPSLLPVPVPEREGASLQSHSKATFKKPTAEQVKAYADERSVPNFDADYFIDHYESNGWKVGKAGMKDWKATVRKWIRNGGTMTSKTSGAVSNVWQSVVKACVSIRLEDPKYPDAIKKQFGKSVASKIMELKVSAIKSAADAKARGNDFLLKDLEKRFAEIGGAI